MLFEEVAGGDWRTLLQGSLLQGVCAELLAGFDALPGGEASLLRATLRAWLECNGQWEPAASRLGVHRHTVRNRVIRAQQLLGLDLESVEDRTRLWLALQTEVR